MDIKIYVSNKIREYRKLRGLTQKELGDKIGVKHNTVSGYESATSEAEQDILFKIANALEISINDLFPPTTSAISLSKAETEHIKKYRALDERGKATVDNTLEKEYEFVTAKSKDTLNAVG